MSENALKPHPRFDHVYAIVRYETDAGEIASVESRVTVKKIVLDPHVAEDEVRRLNALNAGKGAYYFAQVTRIEKGVAESIPVQPAGGTLQEDQG